MKRTLRDEDIATVRRARPACTGHDALERALRRERRRHEVLELPKTERTHTDERDEQLAAE